MDAVPDRDARVIGISRREHAGIENVTADLSDPASWTAVERYSTRFSPRVAITHEELFFHCAGTIAANGSLLDADPAEYTQSVLLNAGSGQVLGRAFLAATSRADCRATLVMCSSPAASDALAGMSHYCGGKAGLEHWTRAVAVELGDRPRAARVFSVVPCAVDTPLLRELMEGLAAETPLADAFRSALADDALATTDGVAREIWDAIDRGAAAGAAIRVGATELVI